MADSRINVILGARDDASKTVTGLRGQFERFKKDAITGFGLGAGIGIFNLATRAIRGVTDSIGDSVAAARAEEAGVARLTTAIEDNIEGWEGGKTAVEGWLAANQEAYLFADNEQRQALSTLIGATRDLTEAQNLLNLSMDLARFRNIDLKTSADLLARVYAGNLGTLSRYGIIVRKGASSTEALAEVQRLAGGQAEAFADTSEASAQKAEMAWGDAQEAFGRIFDDIATAAAETSASIAKSMQDWLPGTGSDALNDALDKSLARLVLVQTEAAGFSVDMKDALEFLSPTLRRWNEMWDEMGDDATAAGVSYKDFGDAIERLERQLGGLVDAGLMDEEALDGAIAAVLRVVLHDMASLEVAAEDTGEAVGEAIGEESEKRAEALAKAIEHVAGTSFEDLREAAKDARDEITAAFKDPMKPLAALRREERRLARDRRRAMRVGRFDIVAMIDERQAEIDVEQKSRRQTNRHYREERAEQQQRRKDLDKLMKKFDLTRQEAVDLYKAANKDITVAIDTKQARLALADLQTRLNAIYLSRGPVTVGVTTGFQGPGFVPTRAAGGPVSPREPTRAAGGPVSPRETYLIGERGPELLHMGSQTGYVTPNHKLGSSGPTVVVMDGRVVGELVDARLGRRSATLGRDGSYRSSV